MSISEILEYEIAIVGGGASGFFTAANLDLSRPGTTCALFEGTSQPLAKVKLSGGGRCNVTHREFDVARLVSHYPRGHRELRGAFSRFQPRDMIAWLEQRGVKTKAEADGRVFPASNESNEIVQCLQRSCVRAGVDLLTGHRLQSVRALGETDTGKGYELVFKNGVVCRCRFLVLATGSHSSGFQAAERLGHTVVPPTPSLFTFNIGDPRLESLAGISFPQVCVSLKLASKRYEQSGPLLITHWGLSGPAILKLSAWASKVLAEVGYRGDLEIDFAPGQTFADVEARLIELKETSGAKQLENVSIEVFPKRYWRQLLEAHGLTGRKAGELGRKHLAVLASEIKRARFSFEGKSTHKDEFVTAGGILMKELDMKTMQSKKLRDLYFVGEICNIDGVTGGFNFQNAWTTGFLCSAEINSQLSAE